MKIKITKAGCRTFTEKYSKLGYKCYTCGPDFYKSTNVFLATKFILCKLNLPV